MAAPKQQPKVTITKNLVPAFLKALEALEGQRVLVGIPAATTSRSNTNSRGINNATIGAIAEYGSPAAHIPARPWLHPGVKSAERKIVSRYTGAAKQALQGNIQAISAAHEIVGQETADAIRAYIRTAPYAPLKPATIAARARQRGTMTRRKGEKEYLGLIRKGMLPAMAELAAGIRALINTGQFLRAISYVVVRRGGKNYADSTDAFQRKGPNHNLSTDSTVQQDVKSVADSAATEARGAQAAATAAAEGVQAGTAGATEGLVGVAEAAGEAVAAVAVI